jgi:chromosome segregation ATPase
MNGNFTGTFSKAQQQLLSFQKEIQELNRTQGDISAYEKQQQAVESTKKKLETLQQQYDNIQREIQETGGYSSDLENKLLSKQQQIDKTSASLERQTQKLDQMGTSLREAGVDTGNLEKESERPGRRDGRPEEKAGGRRRERQELRPRIESSNYRRR